MNNNIQIQQGGGIIVGNKKDIISPEQSSSSSSSLPSSSTFSKINESDKNKYNWIIHKLYSKKYFDECIKFIDKLQKKSEYAVFTKGMVLRKQGKIKESLDYFEEAVSLNPQNPENLKQIGRTMYLLGKHSDALEIYDETLKYTEDWSIFHNKGLCYLHQEDFKQAEDCFIRANTIQKHDITYLELGKLYTIQEKYEDAVEVYEEALDFSPDNPELYTTMGLLFLRLGDSVKAFDYLGTSLALSPKNSRAILATGSIIQDQSEMDVALSKYKIAAPQIPNSAQLWNNIGMCFLGKQDYITAITCLKKALYLAPFEWIIAFNLGLVHLNAKLYTSAFHYFSSCINLKHDFAPCYMYLGVTLNKLNDFENSCSAYIKAIELEDDHLFELNYSITLYNHGDISEAKQHFLKFEKLFQELDEEDRNSDEIVLEKRKLLSQALLGDESVLSNLINQENDNK